MKRLGRALIALLLLWGPGVGAAVTASVDRSQITVSDSLELTIRATAGERVEETDLGPLMRDFDVVSTSTASRLTIVQGRTERNSDLNVVLLPRRTGTLLIPPLTVGNQRTREIAIEVIDAPADVDSSQDVFVEAEVDQSSVYVQSQLIHTFRVYEAIDLVDRGRSQLEIPDAVVEELDSAQFQRTIDGRIYRVIEVRHAIFPQKSGTLTIPAMSFNGSRLLPRRSFFDRNVETLRRRSSPITVEVKPIPADFPDAPWIPAADLELEESWSALPEDLKVGDSVTRTVTIVAEGIDGSQLPPLEQPEVDGLKVYPDQPKSRNTRAMEGITGIGINSAALLVTEPGRFQLPAIRIPWWDTREDRLRYAKIPARELVIRAAALPADDTPAPLPVPGESPAVPVPADIEQRVSIWLWTTLAALLGWLSTTAWLLWRMQPRRRPPEPGTRETGESRLFGDFARACERNAAAEARTALLAWAQRYFDDPTPPTVQQLQERFASDEVSRALDALENSLYSPSTSNWSGGDLIAAIGQWRKQHKKRQRREPSPLPPLYPAGKGTSGTAGAGV
jgi:hypothetical protein